MVASLGAILPDAPGESHRLYLNFPLWMGHTLLPYRKSRFELAQRFFERIVNGRSTTYVPLDPKIACKAAELRAHYNLLLDDAFQLAACLVGDCDAFLTNDRDLKRVEEVSVLLLDEIKYVQK